MKTPIQEVIGILKGAEDEQHKVSAFIEVLEKILPKEREHILDAFVAGGERGTKDVPPNCEQYFNHKYKR